VIIARYCVIDQTVCRKAPLLPKRAINSEVSVITEEERDNELRYLYETDTTCAKKKSLMVGLAAREKTILATEIMGRSGTVQEKEASARTSSAYLKWLEDYENAVLDYEIEKNNRARAVLIVECWRSENANRRQAGVL